MLVDQGFVKASTSDGTDYSFRPSLGRISSLGSPHGIVSIYAGLHGPKAAEEAAYVLACLADQEDVSPLIGWLDEEGWHAGAMPAAEQILVARHLMQHGICGKARPGAEGREGSGKYSPTFDAAEYIAAARVHLGLSSADAEALSMTEFQAMFEMKFPQAGPKKRDVPTREEYEARMRLEKERGRG